MTRRRFSATLEARGPGAVVVVPFTVNEVFVKWLEDAKRQETRHRRLEQAIERLAAGEKEPR